MLYISRIQWERYVDPGVKQLQHLRGQRIATGPRVSFLAFTTGGRLTGPREDNPVLSHVWTSGVRYDINVLAPCRIHACRQDHKQVRDSLFDHLQRQAREGPERRGRRTPEAR